MKTDPQAGYIHRLIREGEHQQQDFKFEISDARKIARSLSAFANTQGGRLLVGVKDNGKIAGIRSEEEIYMIEAAAKLYCKPRIYCKMQTYEVEGLSVLEVIVPEGTEKPYYALDENNRSTAYVRVKDENILATPVHLKVWQSARSPKGRFIRYTDREQILLNYLNDNEHISLQQYCKLISVSRFKAIDILAKLIGFGLIEPIFIERKFYYKLQNEKKEI